MSKLKRALGLAVAGGLALTAASSASTQNGLPPMPPMPPLVQTPASLAETARADAVIAQDPKNLSDIGMLCRPMAEIYAKGLSYKTPAAARVFDNLYYVGTGGVGAWAINTSEGIIVIDALDNSEEAQRYIEGGLRSLGLDPARIKYVVVSHGHTDHYGGAKCLQDRFHASVLISPADWALMASTPKVVRGVANPDGPAHDLDVHDGQKLTLGDTTLTLYITPGHTAGTVSAIFPVKDHGQTHMISFWGGTLFSNDPALLAQYQASVGRFMPIARGAGVEGVISNHPVFDDSVGKLADLSAHPDAPNPFLMGQVGVSRYYEVLDHCLKAQIDRQ